MYVYEWGGWGVLEGCEGCECIGRRARRNYTII